MALKRRSRTTCRVTPADARRGADEVGLPLAPVDRTAQPSCAPVQNRPDDPPPMRHSVGLQFFYGCRDSHLFVPSQSVSVLTARWPVFLVVWLRRWQSPVVGALGVVLVVAGVVFRSLLPTPLRSLVVHPLPRCIPIGMWSVEVLFVHRALDSPPIPPTRLLSLYGKPPSNTPVDAPHPLPDVCGIGVWPAVSWRTRWGKWHAL